ncbi:MAG TPA: hypothetical protein VHC20_06490, partial [Candidatus Paceibacterota bacterium]|nr:hypothetical protein [Candidatus Paceibacterota bacterium]
MAVGWEIEGQIPISHADRPELWGATDYGYDHLGRLTSTQYAATQTAHIANWQLTTDGSQRMRETITYDEAGNRTSVTDALGDVTRYRYDLQGNVIQTVQGGVATQYAYDALGRKIAQQDGNGKTASWTYDYAGELTAHTDFAG